MRTELIENFGWALKDISERKFFCDKCSKEMKLPFFMCENAIVFVLDIPSSTTKWYCEQCEHKYPISDLCNMHNKPKSFGGEEEHIHTCIRTIEWQKVNVQETNKQN